MMCSNQKPDYKYTGEEKYQTEDGTEDSFMQKYCPYPYLPSNDLKEAVNLAITLERPLLLEGEPGCGKTRLAGAVAYEFTKKNKEYLQDLQHKKKQEQKQEQEKWEWKYYIWNIKSTTRARDGLYRYDAVARLRDAQLMGTDPDKLQDFLGIEETQELKKRLKDKNNYIKLGALGEALKEHDYRPILLIDEIDKADSDFANDLLLELEELRFEIPETGESFPTPKNKPIIFITSNREKPLPEPFLRRCLYFYVEFPDEKLLRNIIDKRFGTLRGKTKTQIRDKAITLFYEIRKFLENNPGSKPPGTSEFIDFLNALLQGKNALEDLDNLFNRTPLLGILIKTKPDRYLISETLKKKNSE